MEKRLNSHSFLSTANAWSLERPGRYNEAEPLETKRNVPLHQEVHRPSRVNLGALAVPSLTTFAPSHNLMSHGTAAYSYASMAANTPCEEPQQLRLNGFSNVAHDLFEGRHLNVFNDSSMGRIINMSLASHADSDFFAPLEAPLNFRMPEHRQSRQYAKPEDVVCDLCEGIKLKAYKSCMTCQASFCELHIQDHYRSEALQRHLLVEVTKSLNMNAQLKKSIEEERKERLAQREEIETLTQKKLPDYISKAKTPAAANVVVDPATAHRSLTLSNNQERVHLGETINVHYSEQRFDKWESVQRSEGFSSERHYSEVNREFTVGMTRQSAQRFTFSPSEGH